MQSLVGSASTNSDNLVSLIYLVSIGRWYEIFVLDVLIDERFLFFPAAAVVRVSHKYSTFG